MGGAPPVGGRCQEPAQAAGIGVSGGGYRLGPMVIIHE